MARLTRAGPTTARAQVIKVSQLRTDLAALGLPPGRDVLVHCSMRQVGPVAGGAAGLLRALQAAVGPHASIVVPAQTAHNSLTSPLFQAATRGLDEAGLASYIAAMEPFDPARSPSRGMGALAELVRQHPGAVRSTHPQTSFAAVGASAAALLARHEVDCHLGEESPLGALYAADAWVLLLGVGYRVCTAFHLAEYRRPHPPRREYECFVNQSGARVRHRFGGIDLRDHDFEQLGAAFEAQSPHVKVATVGNATARALPVRPAVDFAVAWMATHR